MTDNDPTDTSSLDPSDSAHDAAPSTPAPAAEMAAQAETPTSAEGAAESDAPSGDEAEGEDDGDGDGDDASAESSDASLAEGDDAGRKKRRRRRRKKKGSGPEGAGPSNERAGHEGRPLAHSPFGRYFEGRERNHAFSAGEIVAGVVTQVADGTAFVDLFGKAVAIIDVLEPREIEAIPEPVVVASAAAAPAASSRPRW